MKHPSKHSVLTTAILGGCMAFGLAGPIAAESNLEIENDGLTLSAFASSSDQVLSINLRIVGPDGFVFEQRIEDSAMQWIPEGNLADGMYRWEAWTVTVENGAPMLEIPVPQPASVAVQSQPAGDPSGASDKFSNPETLEQQPTIPVERLYGEEFKNVHRESGAFRVVDGWLEPIVETDEGVTRSEVRQPGLIGTIAAAVVDFVFPSAHAGTCASPCEVGSFSESQVTVISDDDAISGGPFAIELEVDFDDGEFRIGEDGSTFEPFRLEFGAPLDSLHINQFGNIGLGTGSPTQELHISDSVPRIRIESLTNAQDWYIKNRNSGRFEIGEEANFSGVFTIDPGAPRSALAIKANGNVGIGTDTPLQPLHIVGNNVRIEQTNSTWDLNPGSAGLWFNLASPSNKYGVLKLQNDAPVNSIVANATGVGIGTAAPETPLHVQTSAAADTNMVLLSNDGGSRIYFRNRTAPESGNDSRSWVFSTTEPGFRVSRTFSGQTEMQLDNAGNLSITGTLSQGSSRTIKNNITPLSGAKVLAALSQLDFNEWSYNQAPKQRHAGPMAEDFYDTFGLGPDNKHIAPGDMAGLSLAAVKALHERNEQLVKRLNDENKQLKERLARIEKALLHSSSL